MDKNQIIGIIGVIVVSAVIAGALLLVSSMFFSHKPVQMPTVKERIETALEHIHRYKKIYGEKKAAAEMKKHTSWYIRGLPGASGLRARIFRAKATGEITAALEELLPGK